MARQPEEGAMADCFVANVRLDDGFAGGFLIDKGRIAALVTAGAPAPHAKQTIDGHGLLAIPALVDGHMHLDKTLAGGPWLAHQAEPQRMSRIETDKKIWPMLNRSVEQRATALLDWCIGHGTAHVRTHVDVDLEGGLSKLEGVLAAKASRAGEVTVEIVAFPQSGIMRCPGVADLLDRAVQSGADLVGGLDPLEIDRDVKGHLDTVFEIADHRAKGVDIHLHEPGEMGLHSLDQICERTTALGLGGKVTVSHGFCLGSAPPDKQKAMADRMAKAGVGLVTHGGAVWAVPPLELLHEHGVLVFAGNDDVRDTWNPIGNADMLERATMICWRADYRRDTQLRFAFELCSGHGARALGQPVPAIAVGADASFALVEAEHIPAAVAGHPRRELVLHRGRVVGRDGKRVPAAA
ncbi:amidohydrolase [Desertibaculum subflavum]|uniref:amidohydrolase n=1 Tax=Desertibaculum subflavum TaxID=2268458 RepID=UPI0013C40B97